MTATNHVLTGSLIAALISNPALALPAAFISHFACDSLPHFGRHPKFKQSSKKFGILLVSDCLLAFLVLLIIALFQPLNWHLLLAGGILAASPDLMWLPNYVRTLVHKPTKPNNLIMRFHSWVQWGERPWGMALELIWLSVVLILLVKVLNISTY